MRLENEMAHDLQSMIDVCRVTLALARYAIVAPPPGASVDVRLALPRSPSGRRNHLHRTAQVMGEAPKFLRRLDLSQSAAAEPIRLGTLVGHLPEGDILIASTGGAVDVSVKHAACSTGDG